MFLTLKNYDLAGQPISKKGYFQIETFQNFYRNTDKVQFFIFDKSVETVNEIKDVLVNLLTDISFGDSLSVEHHSRKYYDESAKIEKIVNREVDLLKISHNFKRTFINVCNFMGYSVQEEVFLNVSQRKENFFYFDTPRSNENLLNKKLTDKGDNETFLLFKELRKLINIECYGVENTTYTKQGRLIDKRTKTPSNEAYENLPGLIKLFFSKHKTQSDVRIEVSKEKTIICSTSKNFLITVTLNDKAAIEEKIVQIYNNLESSRLSTDETIYEDSDVLKEQLSDTIDKLNSLKLVQVEIKIS